MDYIEETGTAQQSRDSHILTIYQGMTGIQANDLVGRKIMRDGGAAIGDLLSAIEFDARSATGTPSTLSEKASPTPRAKHPLQWISWVHQVHPILARPWPRRSLFTPDGNRNRWLRAFENRQQRISANNRQR